MRVCKIIINHISTTIYLYAVSKSVDILKYSKVVFFFLWVFFPRYWRFTVQQGRKDDHIFFFFTTFYHSEIFRHLHSLFISIKLISILKLRCLKHKHMLTIFFSLRIFRYIFLCSQLKQKLLIWFKNIRIKLLTKFRMLKRPLQCSCQTQLNVQIWTFKRDHCSVYIKRNIRPWNEFWN